MNAEPPKPPNLRGFTLIELMIVVSIIGILAAIAIPKFADLVRKAREGATKGNLGAIRSAIQVYTGDNEGYFPRCTPWYYFDPGPALAALTVNSKYISSLPKPLFPDYHPLQPLNAPSTYEWDIQDSTWITVAGEPGASTWFYISDPISSQWGTIVPACTHTDSKGSLWTSY